MHASLLLLAAAALAQAKHRHVGRANSYLPVPVFGKSAVVTSFTPSPTDQAGNVQVADKLVASASAISMATAGNAILASKILCNVSRFSQH